MHCAQHKLRGEGGQRGGGGGGRQVRARGAWDLTREVATAATISGYRARGVGAAAAAFADGGARGPGARDGDGLVLSDCPVPGLISLSPARGCSKGGRVLDRDSAEGWSSSLGTVIVFARLRAIKP